MKPILSDSEVRCFNQGCLMNQTCLRYLDVLSINRDRMKWSEKVCVSTEDNQYPDYIGVNDAK